jgi:hypothetical protein
MSEVWFNVRKIRVSRVMLSLPIFMANMNKKSRSVSWTYTSLSILLLAIPIVALGYWYYLFGSHPELTAEGKAALYRAWLPSFLENKYAYSLVMSALAAASFYLASTRRWMKDFPERMVNLGTMVLAALVILQMVFSLL